MSPGKWNGTTYADLARPKKWNGTAWVDTTVARKWNGTSWADIAFSGGGLDPTTAFWFNFEGGTPGQYVTTSHAFGTPFSSVTLNAVPYGSSGKDSNTCVTTPASSGSGLLQWNNPIPVTKISSGFWFKPAQMPDVDARIMDIRQTSTTGTVGGVLFTTTGRFRIMQDSSGLSAGQSPIMTTGLWYWIALTWNASTKTARLSVRSSTGTLLHDSGNIALTTAYLNMTTTRYVRPTVFNLGASSWDMLQYEPDSDVFIPPWLDVSTVPAGYSTYPSDAASFDAGCDAATKTYLPAATYSFNDFTQNNYFGACLNTCVWLQGSGKNNTFIKMNNNTSTKTATVEAIPLGSTNPYHLLKLGYGSGRGGGPLIKYEDFTLTGTPQGHVYGGLRMDYGATGSVMRNVKITGIPGDDSTPPGETFAANLYDCLNVIVDNCEFDGRLDGVGSTPITASQLGLNNSDHATITDTTFKYCGVGFPVAAWQSTGGDFIRCTFDHNNRVPIHLENCDGVWNFTDCIWTNSDPTEFHSTFATAAVYGTGVATCNYYDPVYDDIKGTGKFQQRVIVGSYARPTINLYIGGVLRNDLLNIQYY